MGQILLVRHGQASFGSVNYDQLSTLGEEQSRRLGIWFGRCRLNVRQVVMGDLQRHRQTAQVCLQEFAREHIAAACVDDGWNEYRHQEIFLRHSPAFADPHEFKRFLADAPDGDRAFLELFRNAMTRWMSGDFDGDYTESWKAFQRRCVGALERLLQQMDNTGTTVVFTSAGTIATICQHLLGLSSRHMVELNWNMANCGVTKLRYHVATDGGATPQVNLNYLNNYAHFEQDGSGHLITYR